MSRLLLLRLGFVLALGIVLGGCHEPSADSPASTASGITPPAASKTAATAFPIVTKSGVDMMFLPGGEFTMGSTSGNPDEAPTHPVRLTAFLIDITEVTHEMWARVQLPDPSRWQAQAKGPMERIRWRDAKQYCNERSLAEGLKPCYDEKTADWDCDFGANGYRLPTEAEWEFAARAGTSGAYDFGAAERLAQFAWFAKNAEEKTHPVAQKKPNAWGLHDLYGNVSEWCEDVYDPAYYAHSPATDPTGPPNTGKDVKRVIRGGSWKSSPDQCRVSFRQGERTGDSDACFSTDFCGFRCVRRATLEEAKALATAPPTR